ncbi:MAG: F0F1 ATP synthase subunit B [Thermodesulfovibrionia bacterium]|nr:F0F1 ATP synthase subunit B [Thermodesulfovibrionia bacterium]
MTESKTTILKKLIFFMVIISAVCCLLSPDLASASSEAAENAGAEHHGIAWAELIWPIINFTFLVGILAFFTRKPFKEFFRSRTEKIESSIKTATEAKEIAEKMLTEVRERLNNTRQETDLIIEAAKRTGEKEKASLIAEGEHIKQKIVEQARASIEFELAKARQAIKSEAALLALEAAENEIKKRLGSNEQEKLIDEYIKKIEVAS